MEDGEMDTFWQLLKLMIFNIYSIATIAIVASSFIVTMIYYDIYSASLYAFFAAFFMILIWWYFLFFQAFTKRKVEIHTVYKQIEHSDFEQIEKILINHEFLKTLWKQYKSALIITSDDKKVYSTVLAIEIFNVKSLLQGMQRDFWKNAPGICTGIGILGTFIGLTIGVEGIDMSTNAGLKQGISSLLSGTSTAFLTSIFGLVLAIIMNILYSNVMKQISLEVDLLCNRIDELIPYRKVEDILYLQIEASKAQHQQMEKLISSQHEAVIQQNERITELLNAQVEETKAQTVAFKSMSTDLGEIMNETLLNVQDALDQSIESNFKPIFEELLTTLKAFNSNGMEALADSFNDGAGKQILSFAQTLQELEKGMREVMEQSRIANEESMRQLRQSIEELTQKMNDTIASSVVANTQGTTQNREAMTALIQKVNETLQQAVTEMAQTTQKGNADFSNTMTLSAEKVQAMVDSIQQTTQSQTTGFTELSGQLKISLEETVQLIHKDLHDHEVLMGQLLAEIKETLQSSRGLVKEAGVTAGKFTEAATPMQLVATKMDGQVNTVIDATKTFNQNVKDNVLLLHDSAAKHEQTMTQMEASVEKLASSWKEYEDKFVIVNSNLEKTLTILFENIKRYNDITDAGLKSNLEAFDKSLSSSVGLIADRNDELSNAVGNLSDSIKDLKNIVRTVRR